MKHSLHDDWSYNSVMLQLLGAAGAILANKKCDSKSKWKLEPKIIGITYQGLPLTT